MSKKMSKVLIALLALALCACCVMGVTLAYLTSQSGKVTNTFTVGDVEILLKEKGQTITADTTIEAGNIVPGNKIAKDPNVTVVGGSEACYVFVKIEETDPDGCVGYTVADGWTALNDATGVYYREVATSADDQVLYVLAGEGDGELKNGFVSVPIEFEGSATEPTLAFTAYAIQKANVADAAAAWSTLNP